MACLGSVPVRSLVDGLSVLVIVSVVVVVLVLVRAAAHHLEHRSAPVRKNRTSNVAASSRTMIFRTVE